MNTIKQLRQCIVKDRKACFHKWSEVSKIVDPSPLVGGHGGGVVRITVAIIEYIDDGTVHECYPYEIQFTDKINVSKCQEDISVI